MTADAVPASTVVVLRDADPPGIEVFLVQRAARSGFMGGAHVFPGGRVDETDAPEGRLDLCDGVDMAASRLASLDPSDAVRYHVAAIRETFEECGLLLARDRDGGGVSFDGEAMIDARQAVHRGTRTIWSIVADAEWRLALDALVPFAHWVTPEVERRRFDTRFFLARMPPGQTPLHDAEETVHGVWLSPTQAIERDARNEIELPPPTWRTLSELRRFESVAAAVAWAAGEPQLRRQPKFVQDGETRMLVLPGDPLYEATAEEAVDGVTRFVWDAGRWRAQDYAD